MLKKFIVISLILTVFLAACQPSEANLPAEPTTETSVEPNIQSSDTPPQPSSTVVSPTLSSTPPEDQATEQAQANCTVVSRQPTPGPTEQSLIPPVSDTDWVQGPEDAAVTFIEYGDFQ